MNKKNIKPLIMSSLAALSLGSLSVAGTFALFTDNAETAINIGSGKVIVGNAMTIQSVSSFGGVKDSNTIESSNKVAHYANGGQINVNDTANETGTITIARWTPGDRAVFRTAPTNDSDVSIKVRLKVVISGELAPALVMKVFKVGESDPTCAATGERTLVTDWAEVAPNGSLAAFDLDIAFPDHDNGQILFGADNKDNKYQNKGAVIKVSYEAVQANADVDSYLLEKINTKLATEEVLDGGKNPNMHEAMSELTGIASIADIKSHNYVWGADEDLFYEASGIAAGEEYKYFMVYDSMPTAQSYSIYAAATANWSGANVSLSGIGFDAGDAEGITSVSYAGLGQEKARSNIIRTNDAGTSVVVNAPYDTIYHYGLAGSVDIIAAASNSYHENGKVAFMEVAKGRVVLENDSDVNQIHISTKVTNVDENGDKTKQANVFDEIKIAYAEDVETLPVFSRDAVEIAAGGTLVVELQKVEAEEVKSNEYVWLYQQGLKEQIRVTEKKEVTAEQLAAAPKSTDSAKVEEKTATAAEQIANNLLDGKTYEQLVQEEKIDAYGSIKSTETETLALVEEKGLDAESLDEVKEQKVAEVIVETCKHKTKKRARNDYWKRDNNGDLIFCSDYVCGVCGEPFDEPVVHDLAGMWSNTEHHLVPFVVDNLNAVELMGSEEAVYQYMYDNSLFDLKFNSLSSGYEGVSINDLQYFALFESGRYMHLANNYDYYIPDLETWTAKPAKQGDEGAMDFITIQDYVFGEFYADFFLELDFDLPASLARLCGSYDGWSFAIDPTMFGVESFPKDEKVYVMQHAMSGPGIQYSQLVNMQFLCGFYVDPDSEAYDGFMTAHENLKDCHVTLGLTMFQPNGEKLFDTFELTIDLDLIVNGLTASV